MATFEDYAKDVGPQEKLDRKLDDAFGGVDTHLQKIAECLVELDSLTTKLGLKHQVYKDIVEENPHSIASRRTALIRVWKNEKGKDATYRALLTALCEARETDSADALVNCLKDLKLDTLQAVDCIEPDIHEEPLISLEEGKAKQKKNRPLRPRKEKKELEAIVQFSEEVEFILQTVKDNEYYAAITFLKPPSEEYENPITYPSIGSVVGMFADHKAALIQGDAGARVGKYLHDAIKNFPNAKFIIGIGVGYAFDKKYKLGDVLVSRMISDLANFKVGSDGTIINRGEIIKVDKPLVKLFCNDLDLDYVVAKPTRRAANVYAGTFASCAIHMSNQEMKKKIKESVPEVIGGEMEGGELLRFKEEKPDVGVIVIKGVVDYGDGHKEEEWEFMAASAAVAYAESKVVFY